MKSVQYILQDQEGSEDDKPEQLSESSLGIVGIGKTRDVCAGHEALDKNQHINCGDAFLFFGTFSVTHGIWRAEPLPLRGLAGLLILAPCKANK